MTGYGTTATAGLRNRWTDIFRADTAIHLAVMGSITIGTLQGFLKDRFGGPVPYVGADALLIFAAFFWFADLAIRKRRISDPGGFATRVFVLIAVPILYLMLPGTPFGIQLAGLRAWTMFPVSCLVALTIIRTPGQVRAYVGLILILGLITGVYGILQYRAGPQVAIDVAPLANVRHGGTVFYVAGGQAEFRAFSTFTFPAPFAGFMVFALILATALVVSRHRPRGQRWMAALLIPVLFVGMTVSGTRAALITLLGGLALIGLYRGFGLRELLVLPLLLIALHLGSLLTSGSIMSRYATLYAKEAELWTYVYAPMLTAVRAIGQAPFGLGLGRTGVGVPAALGAGMPPGYFVFSDGDIGRAAAEMGLIGLALLALLVFGLLPFAHRATKRLLKSVDEDLALGLGPLVLATGVLVLIGSPLSSAPHGTIWYFLFGALVKLAMLRTGKEPSAIAK